MSFPTRKSFTRDEALETLNARYEKDRQSLVGKPSQKNKLTQTIYNLFSTATTSKTAISKTTQNNSSKNRP